MLNRPAGATSSKAARTLGTAALLVAALLVAALLVTALLTTLHVAHAASSTDHAAAAGQLRADTTDDLPARFHWPLIPVPDVVRGFTPPRDPYGPGHRGVDLAATAGQQVHAAEAGVVVFAGLLADRGVISIQHDGGLRTTYEPVRPSVTEGQQLYQGQVIGTVASGHPECAAEACLHWGVRRDHDYLNPLLLVRPDAEIRLKPWTGVP